MPTKIVLSRAQVSELFAYLDQNLSKTSCDHTRRLTRQWADQMGIDAADLTDALDDSGGFCDCEVIMNLDPDADLLLSIPDVSAPSGNPWCLPPSFQTPSADHMFVNILQAVRHEQANCYSSDGSVLVSAPKGAKARKRIRKSVHFFVGLGDGLPNEVGFVAQTEGTTAAKFAKQVRDSRLPELARFTDREAAYFLSCLANLPAGTAVGSHFMEVTGISAKQGEQLRIHKVLLRRH